ncbi:MAG: NUDIX hydrolase [Pseudomonadota bacterium]
MRWQPSVTVAAVIERDGKFLCVEERRSQDDGLLLNQPAGHWENHETLIAAAQRETLEETAWEFTPTALLGIYHWQPSPDATFLRFAFAGHLGAHHPTRRLDEGIVRAVWLTRAALAAQADRHRSPLVMQCVLDYCAGIRIPLDHLRHIV